AQLDLGLAKSGVVGGDDEVAHHGQLAAAAQRKTADGRYHRLADAADLLPVAADVVLVVDIGKAVLRHGANVGAGREGFFAAGQDDAVGAVISFHGLERGGQFVHQLVVERIVVFGPALGHDGQLARVGALAR